MELVMIAVAAALVGLLFWAAKRHVEVFHVDVRGGRATVVRGKVPPTFLGDLREIVRTVERGTVRAVREGGEPRLVVSSEIDERTAQRLRNAFAVYPGKRL